MIHPARVQTLKDAAVQNRRLVLYWMQAAQRVEFNHALEYAAQRANELNRPLLVFFSLTADFPEANARHDASMLEGLRKAESLGES